jgi:quinol monooxygenase YgiN
MAGAGQASPRRPDQIAPDCVSRAASAVAAKAGKTIASQKAHQKIFSCDPFRPAGSSLVYLYERKTPMAAEPVTLINLLKVDPSKQAALVTLLKRNIGTVVSTLNGWRASRLIAANDGASVIIYSEWETQAAVEAMRSDPRMRAYFPQILELASFESILGEAIFSTKADT